MPPDPCPLPNGGALPEAVHVRPRVLGRIRGRHAIRHVSHVSGHTHADPAFAHIPAEPAPLGDSCFKQAPSLGRPRVPRAFAPLLTTKAVVIAGGASIAGGGIAGILDPGHRAGGTPPGHVVNVPEPASLGIMAGGVLVLVLLRLRRTRSRSGPR